MTILLESTIRLEIFLLYLNRRMKLYVNVLILRGILDKK